MSVPDDSPPIACSLSAPDLESRKLWLDSLRERLVAVAPTASGIVASFPADPALERQLHALAEAEASCCPFLDFEIEPHDRRLDLRVSGPPDARRLIEELFGAPV